MPSYSFFCQKNIIENSEFQETRFPNLISSVLEGQNVNIMKMKKLFFFKRVFADLFLNEVSQSILYQAIKNWMCPYQRTSKVSCKSYYRYSSSGVCSVGPVGYFLEISLNWGKILWLIFFSDWSVPFPDLAIEKKHDETFEPKFAWVGDSPPWVPNGLLMEEILHHLGWIKSCK